MILDLHVSGKLTSKRAAHVPVIRNWKVVWERREFGTHVDKFEFTTPIELPKVKEEITVPIANKLELKLTFIDTEQVDEGRVITILAKLVYDGIYVPFSTLQKTIPVNGLGAITNYKGNIWKGVDIEVQAAVEVHS